MVEPVVNKAQLQMEKGVASYDNVGAGVGQSAMYGLELIVEAPNQGGVDLLLLFATNRSIQSYSEFKNRLKFTDKDSDKEASVTSRIVKNSDLTVT